MGDLTQRLSDATEGTRGTRAKVRVLLTNPESGYESETNASVTAAEWDVIDRVLCGMGQQYLAAPDLLAFAVAETDVAGARELLEEYANTWAGNTPMLRAIRLILSAYDRQADEIQRQGEEIERLLGARTGIYVASRASAAERPAMWRAFRAAGYPVISTWIDEAGEGETACNRALWSRIEREVTTAERLIFYAEASDFPLKGAYVEVGMALAAGVPVFVVTPGLELQPHTLRPLGSWAMHPLVTFCATIEEAARARQGGPDQ